MKFRKLLMGAMLSLGVLSVFSLGKVNAESDGIIDIGAGKECLYGKFDTVSGATSYDAYVKKSTDSGYTTKLDSELVRVSNSLVRIDAVGLSEGSYNLKFVPKNGNAEITNNIIEVSNINVEADDRSGYAHFNYTDGVGAYNDDGTLKDNAEVIYVTEATKNSPVTYNGNTYENFVKLLSTVNAIKSKPLVVRIIGTVGAASWNTIEYKRDNVELGVSYTVNNSTVTKYGEKTYDIVLKNANGTTITSETDLSNLTDLDNTSSTSNYNIFDTSTYSFLKNLKSKITYGSKKEITYNNTKIKINNYDSYFNMLDADGAENVTIEGIGDDATIAQWGITFKRSKSIEVKNIKFDDYPEDAVAFQGAETQVTKVDDKNPNPTTEYDIDNVPAGNIWVHNCTFEEGKNNWDVTYEQDKHEGDGSTDFKYHKDITVSYCRYNGTHKTGLVGGSENHLTANLTFHHNYYKHCKSRMPYARQANMHMYNNYYYDSTGTTMQIYAGAYAFVENCYFYSENRTFETNDKKYTTPAIKSYNNTFEESSTTSATIAELRTTSVSNGNIFYKTIDETRHNYSSFDTDSSIFYYKNGKSDVTVMNDVSDLPTIIPTVAGAGIMNTTTYSVVGEEPEEDTNVSYDNKSYATVMNDDFSNSDRNVTTLNSNTIPTDSGIYQYIQQKESNPIDLEKTYLEIKDSKLNVCDTDSNNTLHGYYIFGNIYNSGVVEYKVSLTFPTLNGTWNMLTFLGETSNFVIGSAKDTKYLSYGIGNDVSTSILNSAYSIDTEYVITLVIDYTNEKSSITIGGTTISNIDYSSAIKGLMFKTATAERSFYVNSISVARGNETKLGYQFGTYTYNDTEYKALRIVGKFDYSDLITNVDNISSIEVNIDLVNNNSVVYKSVTQKITDIYSSLKLSDGTTIAPEKDNIRYYYVVIKGITSSHNGYKINATTRITLKSGVVINCSGFSYIIDIE